MKEMIKKYKGTLICCTGNACRNFGGFYDGTEYMDKRVFCSDRLYTGDNHLL